MARSAALVALLLCVVAATAIDVKESSGGRSRFAPASAVKRMEGYRELM
jgi:hypothetical protein